MNNATEQIFVVNPSEDQATSTSQQDAQVPPAGEINLESVEDFSNVCRICATITDFIIPIFDGEGLQNNLEEKINMHLPIKVSRQDELPRAVCHRCMHTVLAWHELVTCCAQADTALRTRLRHPATHAHDKGVKPTCSRESQSLQDAKAKEFKEPGPPLPPRLEEPRAHALPSPPVRTKTCGYCSAIIPETTFNDHLIDAHSEYIFLCDDCDTCIDKRNFFHHMSAHAIQYARKNVKEQNSASLVKQETKIKKEVKDENENTQTNNRRPAPPPEPDSTKPEENHVAPEKADTRGENHNNEFSDHSDNESCFGPLPESVFEAIDDSQDSQPAENNEPSQSTGNEESFSHKEIAVDAPARKKAKKLKKLRTCHICSKSYTVSSSYFYHIKYAHSSRKEHKCDVCNAMFGTKGSLNQHMSIHTGERNLECKECGKKFRTNASLYIHEQSHTGVKKYSCSQCQKSFRWRTHLQRHMKRHLTEKAHTCDTCGRGFAIKCDLARHAKTHQAGTFTCKQCGLKFAQERYLKIHVIKKHSESVVTRSKPVLRSSH